MDTLFTTLLILHILSGLVALVLGAVAIFSVKGGKVHLKSGRIYVLSMYVVGFTAIAMTQIKTNTFLMSVGVFTLYLTYTGNKAIQYYRIRSSYRMGWSDIVPIALALLFSIGMISFPILRFLKDGGQQPVLLTFGIILFIFSTRNVWGMYKKPIIEPGEKQWLIRHIGMIGGAYIATLTAFLVTNVTFQPGWVVWLVPTMVGTLLLTRTSNQWRVKLGVEKGS